MAACYARGGRTSDLPSTFGANASYRQTWEKDGKVYGARRTFERFRLLGPERFQKIVTALLRELRRR